MELENLKPYEIVKIFFDKKKQYSLRALARDLKVSPSFVCGVFKGKKSIPSRHVDPLIQLLEIDFESAAVLKQKMNSFSVTPQVKYSPISDYEYLEAGQDNLMSKWYYPAMLELTTLKNFDGDFASALNITNYEAEFGLKQLLQMGLLERQANGTFLKTKKAIRYSAGKSQAVVRNFHRTMMDLAKKELDKTDVTDFEKRYISGLSLSMSSKDVEYAKVRISQFFHELAMELSSKEVDEVYHMGIQFFPVSKSQKASESQQTSPRPTLQ